MDKEKGWWLSATSLSFVWLIFVLSIITSYAVIFLDLDRVNLMVPIFANALSAITGFFCGKATQKSADVKAIETEKNMVSAALSIPGATESTETPADEKEFTTV